MDLEGGRILIRRALSEDVCRIAACWESGVAGDADVADLAGALGVPPGRFVISGRGAKQQLAALDKAKPTAEGLLTELEKLLRFVEAATASQPVGLQGRVAGDDAGHA